jgi:hypothetical protein
MCGRSPRTLTFFSRYVDEVQDILLLDALGMCFCGLLNVCRRIFQCIVLYATILLVSSGLGTPPRPSLLAGKADRTTVSLSPLLIAYQRIPIC